MELVFWLSFACVGYAFVGYPILLGLLCLFKKDQRRRERYSGSVSIVLAARNEEANLPRRLRELLDLLIRSGLEGEILVASDGSTDRTVAIVREMAEHGPVRVIELQENVGKSAALTLACQSAKGDVLVFADARQRWAGDALEKLLENFADPSIGAVSGDLVLESGPGVMAGVGLYWRLEKWLRKKESQLHAQVGVTGAISAVRRTLFRPIPQGALLDDVYWPLSVAMEGHRVVHDDSALAYDRLPDNPRDEFRRKVRTLAGNFQLLTLLPASLLPWRNPVWFQLLSRKLLRLAVPWALLALLISSFLLEGMLFQAIFWAQVGCYALALVGLSKLGSARVPLAATAASFLVLNTAAFLGFWVWITGRAARSWKKVVYEPAGP